MSKTFEQWKAEVDLAVQKLTGLGADDLPDYPYRDDYEEGITPRQAARYAVKAAKEY